MDKVSHRDYSAGFLFGKPGANAHNLASSHYIRDYDFVAVSLQDTASDVYPAGEHTAWIEQRNNFKRGDLLEVLTPQGIPWSFEVTEMWDADGEPLDVARHAQQKIKLLVPQKLLPYSILRRAKEEKSR
jgi:putative protease